MKRKTAAAVLLGITALTAIPSVTAEAMPICPWQQQILDITAKEQTDSEKTHISADTADPDKSKMAPGADVHYVEQGKTLTRQSGVFYGPSGKECYYNLPMNGVILNAGKSGIDGRYWIRRDGVKMYGKYVIVAADLNVHPRGTIVPTSLGDGIVLDTGSFAGNSDTVLDIATAW